MFACCLLLASHFYKIFSNFFPLQFLLFLTEIFYFKNKIFFTVQIFFLKNSLPKKQCSFILNFTPKTYISFQALFLFNFTSLTPNFFKNFLSQKDIVLFLSCLLIVIIILAFCWKKNCEKGITKRLFLPLA